MTMNLLKRMAVARKRARMETRDTFLALQERGVEVLV